MKFIERKLIEEKLNKKIGLKRVGWLTNNFDESFESDHTINDVDLGDALNLVEKFLKNKDMRKIVFFPDSSGWEDCSKDDILKPIFFDDIKEAINFLEENIFYGVDNYYISEENIEWILTICHEEDFHISGSKNFVEEFKQNFL